MRRDKTTRPSDTERTAGFTIIEVLIVLAIAGVIMLLVFEAIPAITRGSRNNQRRQDVAAILQAVSHYELNNSANLPDTPTLNGLLIQYSHLSLYVPASSSPYVIQVHPLGVPALATSLDTVDIYNYERCNDDPSALPNTQGTDYTAIVALYAIETGSGGILSHCEQL